MTDIADFNFEPIFVSRTAPGGGCVLRTFEDIGVFILSKVDTSLRLKPHWAAVRRDLIQAKFGARRAQVHDAMRQALSVEGWLA
jgi:hypothetical protein